MKRCFTLLLALLLALSTLLFAVSCGEEAPADGSDGGNGQAVQGTPLDLGFCTTMIPDGMMKQSSGNGATIYMNTSTGALMMITQTTGPAPLKEDGTIDYSEFDESFTEEALKNAFSSQGSQYEVLEQTYTVLSQHHLYELKLKLKSIFEPDKEAYSTVYVAMSSLDSDKNISTVMLILHGVESQDVALSIRPTLK